MAASLNEVSQPSTPEALRQSLREHGKWPEDRAVMGLLHALELTGGARHRAVATAMALASAALLNAHMARVHLGLDVAIWRNL